jgi:hypothetical protein
MKYIYMVMDSRAQSDIDSAAILECCGDKHPPGAICAETGVIRAQFWSASVWLTAIWLPTLRLPAHSEVTPMSFKYRDSPLYYRTAREALRLEQSGEYDRAAKVWAKANRESRNELNQDWSERRSDFCLMQNMREKRKRWTMRNKKSH